MKVVNLADHDAVAVHLRDLDESGLLAQQISNQGAIHALEYVLANGCSPELVSGMLDGLRAVIAQCEEIAAAKGYQVAFGPEPESLH